MTMMRIIIWLWLALLMSACQVSGKVPQEGDLDFLDRYKELSLVTAEDGREVLRTITPEVKEYSFETLMLDEIVMHPKPDESELLSHETLDQITAYFNDRLRARLGESIELVDQPGPDTPRMKITLTGVKLEAEGMKVTELLPYGAVIGLVRTATDYRNKEVTVLVEAEVTDSLTNKPLVTVVRAGRGQTIRLIWDPEFTLDHVKPLLDRWVDLVATQLASATNNASH